MQYAIEYPYGPNIINRGNRANVLARFRWQKDRDAWVNGAGERHRIITDSRHPYVRLAQRRPENWERSDEGIEVYRVTD